MHLIRVQRNIYADLSAGAMPVCVTIEVVSVTWTYVAATVTGHALQQFGDFLGDLIGLRCLAAKERR